MQITIEKLLSDNDGGVVSVKWTMIAEQNGVQLKDEGHAKFSPDPSSLTFIPFNQLTETKVIEWVSKNINRQAVEQRLNSVSDVNQSVNESAFPWL